MGVDITGPANAPNSVTSRPADTRSFGANDTWFKDCTSAINNDGTKIQAGWLNAVCGQFRKVIRGNGLTAALALVVDEDNTDDMLLNSMQQMIQRNQPRYCADSGAANALIVAPTPAVKEYKVGLTLLVKINAASTGAATINVSGLGVKNIVHLDGSVILPNDFTVGMLAELAYDGTKFQTMNLYNIGRPRLYASRDYYVDSALGNDANDGLAAGSGRAFLTIQRALNVMSGFDNNGFDVKIHVANGTYAGATLGRLTGSGTVYITGNQASPASCVINGFFGATGTNGTYEISGFKIVPGSGNDCVFADLSGTILILANLEMGACSGPANVVAQRSATILVGTAASGQAPVWTISGSANCAFLAIDGGNISIYPQSLVLTGTPNFASAFCYAHRLGSISAPTGVPFSGTSGSATGVRYSATMNSIINGAAPSTYPGNSAGVTANGGQYA